MGVSCLVRFFLRLSHATPAQRDFGGTSMGLRRDFGAGIYSADPPRTAPFSHAEGSYNDPRTQTRDPTRPGPEARRIDFFCELARRPTGYATNQLSGFDRVSPGSGCWCQYCRQCVLACTVRDQFYFVLFCFSPKGSDPPPVRNV